MNQEEKTTKQTRNLPKWWLLFRFYNAFRAALLLISAGDLLWPEGWAFIIIFALAAAFDRIVMSPELKQERDSLWRTEDSEVWDKLLVKLLSTFYLIIVVICGIDYRFQLSGKFPVLVIILGSILVILGYAFRSWAQYVNNFFSFTVRIQKDRGHKVCMKGLYQFVRHPGYLGSILTHIGTPLMLSSNLAFIITAIFIYLYAVRARKEEQVLTKELEGYEEYKRKVRWRFFPFIW